MITGDEETTEGVGTEGEEGREEGVAVVEVGAVVEQEIPSLQARSCYNILTKGIVEVIRNGNPLHYMTQRGGRSPYTREQFLHESCVS